MSLNATGVQPAAVRLSPCELLACQSHHSPDPDMPRQKALEKQLLLLILLANTLM